MRIGREVLGDLHAALAREWLVTNGVGGSASGTVAGANTRRSHALLTAAGPHGLLATLLLRLEERVRSEAGTWDLSAGLPAGDGGPASAPPIEEFRLEPWPTWRYRAGEAVIEKSLFMVHGHGAVAIAWRHLAGPAVTLSVSPLVVAREPDAIEHEDAVLGASVTGVPGRVRVETRPGFPALTLWHNGVFMPARVWRGGFRYPLDPRDEAEHALVPGHVKTPLSVGGTLHLVASCEDDLFRALAAEERLGVPPPRTLAECVAALAAGEAERLEGWRAAARDGADFTARQAAAAHGGPGESLARRREPLVEEYDPCVRPLAAELIAGLTWRGSRLTLVESLPSGIERGVSTLRAVPALVAIRAFDAARQVLGGYVDYLDEGLAPAGFDTADGHPLYGDPAASLWLIHAADVFVRRSGETEFLSERLFQPLESIMQSYRQGTRGGIGVDRDGLLSSGEGAEALKRSDLNALWYHALVAMAQLARLIGRKESGAFYLAWAREHQKQFNDGLWDEARGCLYEGLSARGPVVGLSASQLLAVSLSPPVLQTDCGERLVATIERALVTPLGVRERADAAVASPAWLGHYITACLRVRKRTPACQREAHERLAALQRGSEPLLGRLPAAFEAPFAPAAKGRARNGHDAPHTNGDAGYGRIAAGTDTSSVLAAAEVLRVWIEEIDRAETLVVPAVA
jgi:hypothetical protein